jgi:hypothetical protein
MDSGHSQSKVLPVVGSKSMAVPGELLRGKKKRTKEHVMDQVRFWIAKRSCIRSRKIMGQLPEYALKFASK